MKGIYKGIIGAISLIAAVSIGSIATAHAQTLYAQNWTGACTNLTINLALGSSGSDVLHLQQFLVDEDFPGGGTWMETGYYGAATVAAVKDFQQQEGLPQTGIADAATRSAIAGITCGNVLYTTGTASQIQWNQYGTGYNYNYGTNTYNPLVSLNLTSLSQNTGAPGAQVTIYGTGFDAYNNTINFGTVALSGVPSDGHSLSFIVPQYQSSGTITITVTDSRGTSNAIAFTVYGGYSCGSTYLYGYGNNYGSCGCSYAGTIASGYSTVYPYNYNYSNCGTTVSGNIFAPTISYLTPTSGAVGTQVTILGSGFTATGNSVHFGPGVIANLISSDGNSVSFQVPSQLTGYGSSNVGLGTYGVVVTNGNGYSTNSVSFTVTALNNNGGSVSFTNVNGPSSLAVGSVGTWTVTISNPSNAAVTVTPHWGDANVYPYNSTSVPQTIYSAGTATLTFTHAYAQSGTYAVSFTAAANNGTQAQTTASQTVVVSGSSTGAVPSISSVSPSSGYVGQQVTIYGANFASIDTILFGSGSIGNVSSNGSQITFTIPSYITPYCASGYACPQYAQQVTPGTYNISVMDSYGTSNSVSFQVL